MSSTKRKSDVRVSAESKKAHLAHPTAKQGIQSIITDPDNFLIPESRDAIQKLLIDIALYIRSFEEGIQVSKPKAKSQEELSAAAEKLRNATRSGIRKQMTWKLSRKTGSARPHKFKTRKMPKDEFQQLVGDLDVSVRCATPPV